MVQVLNILALFMLYLEICNVLLNKFIFRFMYDITLVGSSNFYEIHQNQENTYVNYFVVTNVKCTKFFFLVLAYADMGLGGLVSHPEIYYRDTHFLASFS